MLLVVAKDPNLTHALKAQLDVPGLRPFFVDGAEDALFLLEGRQADVLVISLDLAPDVQGYASLLDHARQNEIPVLFLDSAATKPLTAQLGQQGFPHSFTLPAPVTELSRRVLQLLSGDDPLVGQTVGPAGQEVVLRRKLGAGGMGTVYEGVQESLGRKVAVKFISEESQVGGTAERFVAEAKALAKLRSKHVVQVYYIGDHGGRAFSVMELVEGPTLEGLVSEQGPLPETDALRLIRQVLEGLSEVHRHGNVHRDIKPANIMLNELGEPLILDFGLVRDIQGQGVTQAGMVLGTPRYLSPEQAGGRSVDHRADLYSAGIVLFELLTGQAPYQDPDFVKVLMMHSQQALPSPASFGATVSPAAWELLQTLTAKSPDARPNDANAAAQLVDSACREAGATAVDPAQYLALREELEPLAGAVLDTTGHPHVSFGEDISGALGAFNEVGHQLGTLEVLGAFERADIKLGDGAMVLFPRGENVAALHSGSTSAERLHAENENALVGLFQLGPRRG
ncbi:MAG: protein kinase [Acidobacteriota bacterium]